MVILPVSLRCADSVMHIKSSTCDWHIVLCKWYLLLLLLFVIVTIGYQSSMSVSVYLFCYGTLGIGVAQ